MKYYAFIAIFCLCGVSLAVAEDRFFVVALTGSRGNTETHQPASNIIQRVCSPGESGKSSQPSVAGWEVAGWAEYERLWQEFDADRSNNSIRSYLGLPLSNSAANASSLSNLVRIQVSRGRSAPNWLRWPRGSYRQLETPHFQIFSRANDDDAARQVAVDLEQTFWIWTQLFFPLWEGHHQVGLHLKDIQPSLSVSAQLADRRVRLSTRRKMRVVLLRDAQQYAQTLGGSTAGIEQSTGFYGDARQTSFFYPSTSHDAAATRRHEIVHQLFREATRSRDEISTPGSDSDFWLIEGIAGYFESLTVQGGMAVLGGWDSPRLQFARFRFLGQRDRLPFSQLRLEGQLAVQKRADLARWYAAAIAQTHALMDGTSARSRRWVYGRLASLYQIQLEVPDAGLPADADANLEQFLTIDDTLVNANPPRDLISQLCLAGCQVSANGLRMLKPNSEFEWIDLSRLAVGSRELLALCPQPQRLTQLSLEATQVDDSIDAWISQSFHLQELDLSWTRCDDSTVANLAEHRNLKTLWLTGSQVTDESVKTLTQLRSLQSLDVQRTKISDSGVARLRRGLPGCKINPLTLVIQ